MAKRFGDIHCLLKHDHTERDSRYPCDEAYLWRDRSEHFFFKTQLSMNVESLPHQSVCGHSDILAQQRQTSNVRTMLKTPKIAKTTAAE